MNRLLVTAAAMLDRPATFVVPTGNFGDIFAGEAAARMGLAVERLVIATNQNDILARTLNEGVYASGAPHYILTEAQIDEIFDKFSLALADTLDFVSRKGLLAA